MGVYVNKRLLQDDNNISEISSWSLKIESTNGRTLKVSRLHHSVLVNW